MTSDKILEEIQAVDTSLMGDGLSFSDLYMEVKNITAIEQLLFYTKAKKYYYNYTEKRLRILECNITNILDMEDEDGSIFTCKDLENEPDIDISARDFADKIVCYEDYHKVVTYDNNTKHYECFFVDLSKKKVSEFFKEAKAALPPEMQHFVHRPTEEELNELDKSPEVSKAFQTIAKYLYANDGELSEIRFTNIGGGVKIDLIASKFYPEGSMDNLSSFT